MTGKATAAVAAGVIAIVGIAVHPLLDRTGTAEPHRLPAFAAAPPQVGIVAARAAAAALACQRGRLAADASRRPSWCGRYTPGRTQTSCPTSDECTVQMVGILTTSVTTVPVALTVTVRRAISGWQVTAVRS